MRLRAGSSLLYPLAVAVTLGMSLIVGAGCGGGGSVNPRSSATPTATPTPTPTPTPTAQQLTLRTVVVWGQRSRQSTSVSGPGSALSAVLELRDRSNGDLRFSQTLNRGVQGGRQTYTSPGTVATGSYDLVMRFYALPDAQGQVVGVAAAGTSVNPDASTPETTDGTLSTTIAAVGTIENVIIPANQTIAIGQTKSLDLTAANGNILIFEPRDRAGNLIAITPGSAFINRVDAQSNSTVPGVLAANVSGDTITGVAPQRATITVRVDDAVSAPTPVIITSSIVAGQNFTVTPPSADISLLQSQTFTASIQNDGPAGSNGVRWSILDNGDGSKGDITQAGVYTATRTEGNFTIRATSVYDPRVFVDVPVRVESKVAVIVTPNPAPVVSIRGGQLQFAASVTNVPEGQDAGVTYRVVQAGGGTITPEGLYTAPTPAGDYSIVVTSNFDNRKSTTVTVPVRSLVQFNPASIPDQTISINGRRAFSVTVSPGVPNGDTSVTFSIQTTGAASTIDSGGNFTAGARTETVRVRATSNFDPNQFIEFNVRVVAGSVVIGVG